MIYKFFVCSIVLIISSIDFSKNTASSSNVNIYYFGDSAQIYLKQIYYSQIQYLSTQEDSFNKENFFLVIRHYDKGFGVSFNYSPTEQLKKITRNNNVYYQIDENVLIPLISDYDLNFSNYLRGDKNSRTVYHFDGPIIKFDIEGKIIK